jgi:hypothetical protein
MIEALARRSKLRDGLLYATVWAMVGGRSPEIDGISPVDSKTGQKLWFSR